MNFLKPFLFVILGSIILFIGVMICQKIPVIGLVLAVLALATGVGLVNHVLKKIE